MVIPTCDHQGTWRQWLGNKFSGYMEQYFNVSPKVKNNKWLDFALFYCLKKLKKKEGRWLGSVFITCDAKAAATNVSWMIFEFAASRWQLIFAFAKIICFFHRNYKNLGYLASFKILEINSKMLKDAKWSIVSDRGWQRIENGKAANWPDMNAGKSAFVALWNVRYANSIQFQNTTEKICRNWTEATSETPHHRNYWEKGVGLLSNFLSEFNQNNQCARR